MAESPPKELLKAAEGLQNMAIAHEIALNQNFKIDKIEPEDDTLYKKVKDILHKAYWDILSDELSQSPPVYTQAMQLLEEIKQSLDELLFPHNARTKESINEVLDIALIKQQAENGVLDFSHYAQYVISLMAKICAPVRDERIAELKNCTNVIETFKGVMEVLELMKLDLTNFTINMYRPTIVASSIEYEKRKFSEFLKVQEDGLRKTRSWLSKYLTGDVIRANSTDANAVKQITDFILIEAYLDLLEFDITPSAETLMLDQGRIIDLRNKTCRLVINGSILSILSAAYPLRNVNINEIKEHITVLLDSINSNKDLEKALPNIVIQVKADIEKIQDSANAVSSVERNNCLSMLEKLILELSRADHRIRQSISSRIKTFFKSAIMLQSPDPQQIPSVLSLLGRELMDVAKQFLILITRNRTIFEEYYQKIVTLVIRDEHSDCAPVH
ncbi:PREDICTED: T-complex protein 11-like protein 1 [Ceratosolen solmsi marchali]|uniref:T-complex protein 11-like protein 1 n=1 Tax=Ceratosolen solmsi marchali TaxID=326594 RepID=A0AAJ6YMG5_9HYME|nr:PREDICTED: T-complex protein 11-like protein 1 [Ceratosolen solmsi marchali]